MADSPWTIKSTKRRRTTNATPAPRNKARTSPIENASRSTRPARPSDQSTLTQIDFVKNFSFDGEDEVVRAFDEIETPAASEAPPKVKRQTSKKRDSTLTQLDWATNNHIDEKYFALIADDTPTEPARARRPQTKVKQRTLKKRDSTLTQLDWLNQADVDFVFDFDDSQLELPESLKQPRLPTVPPFDGAADHEPQAETAEVMPPPSRTRSKKSSANPQKQQTNEAGNQEYELTPATKRRKVKDEPATSKGNPRRSARKGGLGTEQPKRPPMIIQDSTDFAEDPIEHTGVRRQEQLEVPPITPTKNRDRIPSSQTPESIRMSTKRRTAVRQPLAELSANTQLSPSKSARTGSKKSLKASSLVQSVKATGSKQSRTAPAKQSPKRSKVCILKVPPSALLPRTSRIDDSQQDIWSLQPTSSPKKSSPSKKAGQSHSTITIRPDAAANSSTEGPTIHESQVAHTGVDTQKSLPDLDQIFPSISAKKKTSGRLNASRIGELKYGDVEDAPTAEQSVEAWEKQQEAMLQNQEPINMIPELGQIDSDEMSDFGTPRKNNTQYVGDLEKRISSPLPSSVDGELQIRAATDPVQIQHKSPIGRSAASVGDPRSPLTLTPLPAPRLVPSPARSLPRQTTSSTLPTLPAVLSGGRSQNRSLERIRIMHVPLNDTNEYQQHISSSSSPALLPPPLPATQRSAYPLSMPHPSQVSTQAPSTQGYFPSSQQHQLTQRSSREAERITIKDSSSFLARPSQSIQQAELDDDLDAFAPVNLVEDSQDEDELDLDPSTYHVRLSKTKGKASEVGGPVNSDETTQTPTQRTKHALLKRKSTTQDSPIVLNATTRSQRDAELDIIALLSSSQDVSDVHSSSKTPRPSKSASDMDRTSSPQEAHDDLAPVAIADNEPRSSSISSSIVSPSPPRTLKRKYSPIPGFDNETQSDFTQGGHVTAAYVHRGREEGWLPKNYVPKPYKAKNWKKSMYEGSKSKKTKTS